MLLPKGGVTWKSARSKLPPWKAVVVLLTRTRVLVSIAIASLVILLWRGISKSAAEMQKYVQTHPLVVCDCCWSQVQIVYSRDHDTNLRSMY
jgi:hypothetical protein